ncbi:amidohydrolase [Rothia mucilaginosa]|uniref:amidohydrolase n=1 Tax=Rothia mucilaginosa TaxID=43675 RepID=UPI0028E7E976|nr:amidohydrolase [Rothia mucilaginosa]
MSTRIFVDGSVYSPVDPYATAMLVEDGFVRWVGSDSGARSIADESATITELDGALLTPTFARALAPVAGKEAPEILDYLQTYRAAGYHTHTLLAGMEDVPDLVSALSYYSAEHGVPDIRLILNATGVETDELISAIKALRPLTEGERAVKGLQLVGIFVAPTEAPAAAQVAEDAALLLSIDASTSFTTATDAALAVRETRPWLPIRLDAAISTPQDPITDEHLTQLAEARINLGLSVCEPEEDEAANDTVQALLAHAGGEARESVASVARRANATGTSIALGSDTQLYAPGAWSLIRELVNDEHGISARSAFAALTRGVYRLAHEENPFTGQFAPDNTPAYVAQWRVEALMVQAPDSRVASWSTDPRARIPLLPVLDEDSPLPVLESIYTESN